VVSEPTVILDDVLAPFYHWFPDGVLNTCYNALDRHVEAGRGDQAALIYDSAMTGRQATYSYTQLRDEVALFAGALSSLGVVTGDRVVIYMPMIPHAVIAMLACARLGAVHSVVFGGFAAHELASRIDDAKPKVLVYASCGLEPNRVVPYKPLVDGAIEEASYPPQKCVVFQRPEAVAPPGRLDFDWQDLIANVAPVDCVPVAATDPLYILYTSGTTGRPRGVLRDNGGHAVALRWTLPNIYDTHPGDVYWAASDVGWVVGTATSCTAHCSPDAPPFFTRASPLARLTRVRSGGWSASTASGACSPRRLRSARSRRRIRGPSILPATTSAA
jgi:propionyl-CoA synthetase